MIDIYQELVVNLTIESVVAILKLLWYKISKLKRNIRAETPKLLEVNQDNDKRVGNFCPIFNVIGDKNTINYITIHQSEALNHPVNEVCKHSSREQHHLATTLLESESTQAKLLLNYVRRESKKAYETETKLSSESMLLS